MDMVINKDNATVVLNDIIFMLLNRYFEVKVINQKIMYSIRVNLNEGFFFVIDVYKDSARWPKYAATEIRFFNGEKETLCSYSYPLETGRMYISMHIEKFIMDLNYLNNEGSN